MEGSARAVHRGASRISPTPQEGIDDPKREEIQRRLCKDRHDDFIARDIGLELRRVERDLSASRIQGQRDTQATRAQPSHASDGFLSLSAEIYQLGCHRDACTAGEPSSRRRVRLAQPEAQNSPATTAVDRGSLSRVTNRPFKYITFIFLRSANGIDFIRLSGECCSCWVVW
jgi:hypothetical protein